MCEDADTAVRVCGREEEVGVHLATVLAHCYHTPHSLSRLYTRAREWWVYTSTVYACFVDCCCGKLWLRNVQYLIIISILVAWHYLSLIVD